MNNEEYNEQSNSLTPPSDPPVDTAEEPELDDQEQLGKKQPPKIRWI